MRKYVHLRIVNLRHVQWLLSSVCPVGRIEVKVWEVALNLPSSFSRKCLLDRQRNRNGSSYG